MTSPLLRYMTTCLTATWKTNARAPERRTKNLPKVITPSCHQVLKHKIQDRKRLQPHPWSSHRKTRVGFKMATGWLEYLLDHQKFPVNLISGLFTKNGKSCRHPRYGSSNVCGVVVNRSTFLTCYFSFEAMLYFLYTGEIKFAPFRSYPGHQLPARERTGDWNAERLPSPSAKSIYRLADMVSSLSCVWRSISHQLQYHIPTLKQQAKAYIHSNMAHCNIVDEVFSTFSFS